MRRGRLYAKPQQGGRARCCVQLFTTFTLSQAAHLAGHSLPWLLHPVPAQLSRAPCYYYQPRAVATTMNRLGHPTNTSGPNVSSSGKMTTTDKVNTRKPIQASPAAHKCECRAEDPDWLRARLQSISAAAIGKPEPRAAPNHEACRALSFHCGLP